MTRPAVSPAPRASESDLGLLRETVRDFAAALSSQASVRAAIDSEDGYDSRAWRRAVDELGLGAMLLPAAAGGLGFGLAELAVVATELGAAIFCGPLLGTFLASSCLAALTETESEPGDHAAGLSARLAAGTQMTLVAPSFPDVPQADWPVTAQPAGQAGTVLIRGTGQIVPDAGTATCLLVGALAPDGWVIAAAEADAAGLGRQRLRSLDLTRRLYRVTFDGVPARVLARGSQAFGAIASALAAGQVALAADSTGLAAASLDRVVGHLKTRHQFGRALGSFQALKHTCADLLVELETARTALTALSEAEGAADERLLAAVAKIKATEAGSLIATESIQLTGGIGYTWEHPAHLYYRRAKSNEVLLGSPAEHRRAVYRLLDRDEEGVA